MQWLYEAITLGDPRPFQLAFCLCTLNIVRTVLKKEKGVERRSFHPETDLRSESPWRHAF
jgi:hypothetical protein